MLNKQLTLRANVRVLHSYVELKYLLGMSYPELGIQKAHQLADVL